MTTGPTGQNPFPDRNWPPRPQQPYPPNQWQVPPPNRNRAWIVGISISVAVLLAAVIGIVVWSTSGRDHSTPRAPAQTASTFPNKPTKRWTVNVEDIAPGPNITFGSSELYSTQPNAFEIDGHTFLTTRSSDNGAPTLHSLNTDNGQLEWSTSGDAKVCAHELLNGRLACIARTGDSSGNNRPDIVFRNIRTGEVERTSPTDYPVTGIAVVDGSLITTGYDAVNGDSVRVVSRGTADDLGSLWTVSKPADGSGCTGPGDVSRLTADSHAIVVGNGVTTWFFRTSDGRPLIDEALASPSYQENGGIVGARCIGDGTTRTNYVYAADGTLLRSSAASTYYIEHLGTDGTTQTPAPYVDQQRVLDLRTGRPIWPGTDSPPNYLTSTTAELIGDTLIMEDFTSSGGGIHATGYAIATGEKLWDGLDFVLGQSRNRWLTDGTRVFGTSAGLLMAADLHTGKRSWVFGYSDGDQEAKLYPINRGILIVTDDTATYVEPK